jgi:hypothetical protein
MIRNQSGEGHSMLDLKEDRGAKSGKELVEMKENVRRAVESLELCWRCQHVSECQKYVLGNMILVWLCPHCLTELHQPQVATKPRARASRKSVSPKPAL